MIAMPQVGMRAMSLYNGAAGIARMFGLPLPKLPATWRADAQQSVELLMQESAVRYIQPSAIICNHLQSSASICNHLQSSAISWHLSHVTAQESSVEAFGAVHAATKSGEQARSTPVVVPPADSCCCAAGRLLLLASPSDGTGAREK